ncbi:HTH-type transcriptional repressor fabR [Providencia rustigianii]|nr:HTH-type transcriptional repressor fabR [Providencia rustigianii]
MKTNVVHLEERLVLQLRMIAKGAYYWYRREQEKQNETDPDLNK